MAEGRTILYFVTEDWYLCSHRLPLVREAVRQGYRVVVVTRVGAHSDPIEATGAELIPFEISRRSKNLSVELGCLLRLVRIYRQVKPDICHHVALKPVLYGSLAARLAGVPVVVNALAGLGFMFTSHTATVRIARQPLKIALRVLLVGRHRRLIVQNADDRELLHSRAGIPLHTFMLIAGSGVDLDEWPLVPEPDLPIRVAVVSRMLWDKGIGDLVEAAKILREEGNSLRISLVGPPDLENPSAIPQLTLDRWEREGLVRCTGRIDDIAKVWRENHIAVLPSYREGLPKSLLEAAACGRPMIATDVPGCRDVVRPGVTGLLVPSRDPPALAGAIKQLASDASARRRMGQAGREMVEREYTVETVTDRTLALYKELLAEAGL